MKTSEKQKIIVGIVIMSFTLMVFAYIVGGLFYVESRKVKARDGFCPRGTWAQKWNDIKIPGRTFILVDTSNKISLQDGEKAFSHIEAWTRQLPILQEVSVYGLPADESKKPDLLAKPWCVPKQGKTANVLYENPRLAEVAFKGKFLTRIQKIFRFLLEKEEANHSPILETLTRFAERDDVDSVWLVSDMLQHSPQISHYNNSGDMASLCAKLNFAKIKIYYVERGVKQQSLSHREKWEECFGDANVEWQ